MKAGIYTVRGESHGEKTPPIEVTIGDDGRASFTYAGRSFVYRARERSPFPERVEPKKGVDQVDGLRARSAAINAYKAAAEAAKTPPPADDDLDVDDVTIGMMARRSGGPDEGRYTRHGR